MRRVCTAGIPMGDGPPWKAGGCPLRDGSRAHAAQVQTRREATCILWQPGRLQRSMVMQERPRAAAIQSGSTALALALTLAVPRRGAGQEFDAGGFLDGAYVHKGRHVVVVRDRRPAGCTVRFSLPPPRGTPRGWGSTRAVDPCALPRKLTPRQPAAPLRWTITPPPPARFNWRPTGGAASRRSCSSSTPFPYL